MTAHVAGLPVEEALVQLAGLSAGLALLARAVRTRVRLARRTRR